MRVPQFSGTWILNGQVEKSQINLLKGAIPEAKVGYWRLKGFNQPVLVIKTPNNLKDMKVFRWLQLKGIELPLQYTTQCLALTNGTFSRFVQGAVAQFKLSAK